MSIDTQDAFAQALFKYNGGKCWHKRHTNDPVDGHLVVTIIEAPFYIGERGVDRYYSDDLTRKDLKDGLGFLSTPVLKGIEGIGIVSAWFQTVFQTGYLQTKFGITKAATWEPSAQEQYDLKHAVKDRHDPLIAEVLGGVDFKPEPLPTTTHFLSVKEMIEAHTPSHRDGIHWPSRFNPALRVQTSLHPGEPGAPFTREMEIAWYVEGYYRLLADPSENWGGVLTRQDYIAFVEDLISKTPASTSTTNSSNMITPQLLRHLADQLEKSSG